MNYQTICLHLGARKSSVNVAKATVTTKSAAVVAVVEVSAVAAISSV